MEPDWVGRAMALVALIIAAANPTISWLTYRKHRTRVSIQLQRRFQHLGADRKPLDVVPADSMEIDISVKNSGADAVQVHRLALRMPGAAAWLDIGSQLHGRCELPSTLDGGHQADWRVNCMELAALMNRHSGGNALSFQLLVFLGSGQQVESENFLLAPFNDERFGPACKQIRKIAIGD